MNLLSPITAAIGLFVIVSLHEADFPCGLSVVLYISQFEGRSLVIVAVAELHVCTSTPPMEVHTA